MSVALILIPCSKKKSVEKDCKEITKSHIHCIGGRPVLDKLRKQIIKAVGATHGLADNPHNRNGILNNNAPHTLAHRLYVGALNEAARPVTNKIPIDNFHILIVSGLYGLVHTLECIRDYGLDMDDIVVMANNNEKVFDFWFKNELWRCLCQYVIDNGVTHIWSLLPNGYHRLFFPIMKNRCGFDRLICRHVFPLNIFPIINFIRGKWLTIKFNEDQDFFTSNPPDQEVIMMKKYKGQNVERVFEYRCC